MEMVSGAARVPSEVRFNPNIRSYDRCRRCQQSRDWIAHRKREAGMNMQRRYFLLLVTLTAAATPALAQTVAPAIGPVSKQSAASAPDFSGFWSHLSLPGFEPPLAGPGPVVNKSRTRQLFDA